MEEPEREQGDRGGNGAKIPMMYDEEEMEMELEDVEDFDDPGKFQIEEEMVAEVMKCLEEEITRPSSSSSSYVCSWAGAPFVTINGNEESCGPSFSDSASSVMASIDTRGVAGAPRHGGGSGGGGGAAAGEVRPWLLGPAWGVPAAGEELCVEDVEQSDDGCLALAGGGFEVEG
ncbi:unnamed protein product [Spirodela intermedia]|uniref:Uncharacterized protein n=1 Tax=Spirodela intermedia TaxID=51605 RepID=A0A7I8KYL8_SPIIN|nr:unnamed protein product [Spirodela intermedia]